jgi:hypothetical protein
MLCVCVCVFPLPPSVFLRLVSSVPNPSSEILNLSIHMEYSHSEMYIAININENRRDNQEKTMERHWKDKK